MYLNILDVYRTDPWLFYTTIAFVGLCVGSFLNVVVHRLPLILRQEWRSQCQDYLELDSEPVEPVSLSKPRSRCPECGHMITAIENIPVLSYLFLKGRCSACSTKISLRYPAIEIFTALLSLIVAYRFGVSIQMIFALLLTWSLIALTFIDIDTQLLPDDITLPLLWIGICIAMFDVFTDLQSSVIGAVAGYMILWLVFQSFRVITGKEGMGFGDFKLLAASGAWLGYQQLPQLILISSVVGSVIGITLMIMKRGDMQSKIPFGPYIALATWLALILGDQINAYYHSIF